MVSFRHSFLTLGQLQALLFIWGKGVGILEAPLPPEFVLGHARSALVAKAIPAWP